MLSREYFKSKRKFMRLSLLVFGIPVEILWIWLFDAYQNIYFFFFVSIVVCFCGVSLGSVNVEILC
jgi:hypothetical protein